MYKRQELRTETLPEVRFDSITEMFLVLDMSVDPRNCRPLANHLQGCPRSFAAAYPESILMRTGCVSLLEKVEVHHKVACQEGSEKVPTRG